MKLQHIELTELKPSPLNVRKKGGKDVADLAASIRSIGLIQPLLVRPNCEGFEIVAGQRRFHALQGLAQEGQADPVPCIVMEDGDDARAIEASLAENVARLPMDEIDQYKAFSAMREQGLDIPDIAARFGVTQRLVEQRLAIAGIISPILNAYRRDEISADTLRTLTMATPRQQKAWWKLAQSNDEYAPHGRHLREWLFGGAQIATANALFDEAAYDGAIISDLFGEERYFADAQKFWTLQNKAIAQAKARYLDAGWKEVVVLDAGEFFRTWEHEKRARTKGGKVFVAITQDGEVTFHEGFVSSKEAKRQRGTVETGEAVSAARPELTKAMRNYLGIHRHAAVRTELLAHHGIALRLVVAHIIAGSGLWRIDIETQRTANEGIAQSIGVSSAMTAFNEEGGRVRALLGIDAEDNDSIVSKGYCRRRSLPDIFQTFIRMDDAAVMQILTYVMAETLEAHTDVVDMLGALLSTDMRDWWKPDQTFFDLLRDKEALNAMVAEIAGTDAAAAHVSAAAKVQKKIVADCLEGTRQAEIEDWSPRYMRFPAEGYTTRFAAADQAIGHDHQDDDDDDHDDGHDHDDCAD